MRHLVTQMHARNQIAQHLVRTGECVTDPMAIAVANATALTATEISQRIDPIRDAVKAMTLGKGTFVHWVTLCSAYNVAAAIEHGGVVRGYKDAHDELNQVLGAIGHRAGGEAATWKPPTLWAHEIKTLRLQAGDHKFQLSQLSYREFINAYEYAVAKVRSTRGEVFKQGELQ